MNPVDTTRNYPQHPKRGEGEPRRETPLDLGTPKSSTPAVDPPTAWQSIWFAARAQPWRSLAVVPVGVDTASVPAAKSLQAVARTMEGTSVTVVDGTGLSLGATKDILSALDGPMKQGGGRIIAVDSPLHHPASIPLARAADAAILLVDLGRTTAPEAERVLDLVGRDRFVGVVSVRQGREGPVID